MGIGDDTFEWAFGKPKQQALTAEPLTAKPPGGVPRTPEFDSNLLPVVYGYGAHHGSGSVSPPQRRIRLYALTGTAKQPALNLGEFIEFEYAPEEFTDSKSAGYEEKGKKVCTLHPKFEKGGNRKISMTLFLNDWARSQNKNPRHDEKSVEQKIEWLQRCLCPHKGSIAGSTSPPVLGLVWRELFKCVLTSISVKRIKLDPMGLGAIRANVDIELMEWVPEPE